MHMYFHVHNECVLSIPAYTLPVSPPICFYFCGQLYVVCGSRDIAHFTAHINSHLHVHAHVCVCVQLRTHNSLPTILRIRVYVHVVWRGYVQALAQRDQMEERRQREYRLTAFTADPNLM